MTVFLSIVDRNASDLVRNTDLQRFERTRNILAKTADLYKPYVGPDYSSAVNIKAPVKRRDVQVLHWERHLSERSLRSSGNYWAISGGHQVGQELVDNVRPRGGKLVYARPIWGHYAAVFGTNNRSQVFAWNTTPALEAVHWGATEDYVVITNRPLLAALCLSVINENSQPSLSYDYLVEYLLYGYSLTGKTPFDGIYTLSVNNGLTVTNGRVSLTELPIGMQSELAADHTLSDAVEALSAALVNSMDRTQRQLAGRPVQLRLSGGKDSRLLLALMRNRDIDYRTVTFGSESNIDVKLANILNSMAHAKGEVRAPRPNTGTSISERIETTIRESGGLPPSEPHTAQYRGADPESPREAVMMGQWPLYKGGLATKMRLTSQQIKQTLVRQGGALVNKESRAPYDAAVLEWADRATLGHDLESLYLFAREFRSGRYLHAHVSQFSSSAMIAYPIADAEIAAVCDALTMYEKVSEKALFGALQRIWPEIMKVPLDRSRWRFEANGKDSELSGPWYSHRYDAVPDVKPQRKTTVESVVAEYSDEAIIEMSSYLARSNNFEFLLQFLSEDLRTAIRSASEGEISTIMPKRTLAKFVWRVCAAEVWLSRKWMQTY